MIQLVERLNTEYDVQNISSREAAEQALDRLTVSAYLEGLPKNMMDAVKDCLFAHLNRLLQLLTLSVSSFLSPPLPPIF